MNHIAISKFKAGCLAMLENVHSTGQPLVVTRRGKALARVVPVGADDKSTSPIGCMAGTAEELADIVAPVDTQWSACADDDLPE